jgi:DNA segregation ATPase FtsK/SpoIIIE-like protein
MEAQAFQLQTERALAAGEGALFVPVLPLTIGMGKDIAGNATTVTIPATSRIRHVYVIGTSQVGKSTLMMQMVKQDMERGRRSGR